MAGSGDRAGSRSGYRVEIAPRFARAAKKLAAAHPQLAVLLPRAIAILAEDPLNVSGRHAILKLRGVEPEEGQYRLRLRRFRIRYDVLDDRVVRVLAIALRREDTYR